MPYYFVNPIANVDSCGGYTATCDFSVGPVPRSRRTLRYEPLETARYALKMLAVWEALGSVDARDRALAVAGPLLRSGLRTGAWGPGESADTMSSVHPSEMVQGVVISALIRLNRIKAQAEFPLVIEQAKRRLMSPIAKGGTRSSLDGAPFLEEVPRFPPAHVLNGGIYALFGLFDLADGLGDPEARFLGEAIVKGLDTRIHRFAAGFGWSRYALDLRGRAPLASFHYHQYHIVQVGILAQRTGSASLHDVVETWKAGIRNPACRGRAALAKIVERLEPARDVAGQRRSSASKSWLG